MTANTPHSNAWAANAPALAEWTDRHFVNRHDVFGAYRPEHEIGKEYTKPDGSTGTLGEQMTVKRPLKRTVLLRHFRAIIGAHIASADNLTKGGALDIDWHGDGSTAPELNHRAALWWYARL